MIRNDSGWFGMMMMMMMKGSCASSSIRVAYFFGRDLHPWGSKEPTVPKRPHFLKECLCAQRSKLTASWRTSWKPWLMSSPWWLHVWWRWSWLILRATTPWTSRSGYWTSACWTSMIALVARIRGTWPMDCCWRKASATQTTWRSAVCHPALIRGLIGQIVVRQGFRRVKRHPLESMTCHSVAPRNWPTDPDRCLALWGDWPHPQPRNLW